MFPTATYPITASRYVVHNDHIDFVGFDYTGATLKMQVRDRKNGGAIRADLAQVTTAAAEGVRIDSVTTDTDGIKTTRIAWRINKTTMSAMPVDSADPDADLKLHYDMHLTPSGSDGQFVPVEGPFVVKAGVTQ